MSSSLTAAVDSPSLPPLPDSPVVVGCGGVAVDYLATVAAFPKPDDKIRSTSLKVQGGGNAGNALTCAARLGLKPRLISKLANDAQGRIALAELEKDGIDTSYIVVSQEGNSPFTYIIVDNQTKTRTCILTPGNPELVPNDLPQSSLSFALNGARLVYSDCRFPETALVVAQEATRMKIPILIDAERRREGLDDLFKMASYVVCSERFPRDWTTAPTIPSALLSILMKLPNVRFVIVTLGERGCIMLERSINEVPESDEMDIDSLVASLKEKVDVHHPMPTCISSKAYVQRCHLKKCYLLLLKWRRLDAELWVLALVYHCALIPVWLRFCIRGVMQDVVSPFTWGDLEALGCLRGDCYRRYLSIRSFKRKTACDGMSWTAYKRFVVLYKGFVLMPF